MRQLYGGLNESLYGKEMRKIVNAGSFLAVVSILTAACGQPGEHSSAYYQKHESERATLLIKCNGDPSFLKNSSNCSNAADAQFRSGNFTPSPPRSW